MQSRVVRSALIALAFMSILFTLSGLPQKGLNYWYLFFSPMVLAASYFGIRGAVVTSGAAMAAVLLLYQRTSAAMGEYVAAGLPPGLGESALETYGHAFAGMALMTVGALATGVLTEHKGVARADQRLTDRAPSLHAAAFRTRLQSLVRAASKRGTAGAVLQAHIPGFTRLTHELGDAAATAVWEQVAARLQTHLRANDALCWFGAGDLAVALDGAGKPQAEAVANRLIGALAADPVIIAGRRETLSANVGVALYPGDATDADTLLAHAEDALHHAHTDNGVYFHRPIVVRLLPS